MQVVGSQQNWVLALCCCCCCCCFLFLGYYILLLVSGAVLCAHKYQILNWPVYTCSWQVMEHAGALRWMWNMNKSIITCRCSVVIYEQKDRNMQMGAPRLNKKMGTQNSYDILHMWYDAYNLRSMMKLPSFWKFCLSFNEYSCPSIFVHLLLVQYHCYLQVNLHHTKFDFYPFYPDLVEWEFLYFQFITKCCLTFVPVCK